MCILDRCKGDESKEFKLPKYKIIVEKVEEEEEKK
jgi:hypothetical protein